MLSVAYLLHHPLVCLGFLLWGITAPWFHEQHGEGHPFIRSLLIKMGHEQAEIDDLSFEPVHDVIKPQDVVQQFEMEPEKIEDWRPEAVASPKQPSANLEEYASLKLIEPTTTTEPAQVEVQHHSRWDRHHHRRFCPTSVVDSMNHIGKWGRGSIGMHLHYVCESSSSWCPPGWKRFESSCYRAELSKVSTFFEASQACRIESQLPNTHLVVIGSQAENDFVMNLVARKTVWIGFSNVRGYWWWVDGTKSDESTFANWDDMQPPNHHGGSQGAFMNYWKALCMPPPWMGRMCPLSPSVMMAILIGSVVLTIVTVLLVKVIFLCTYKSLVTDKRQALPDFRGAGFANQAQANDFQHHAFGCCEDMSVCCHSFFCSSLRAADTHKAMGTGGFWSVILWWLFARVAGKVIAGGTGFDSLICGVMIAAVMTHKRQLMKAKLGIAPGNACQDFFFWWCCTPCAVAQEARQVDELAGVSVHCCCNLVSRQGNSQIVGPPMALSATQPQPSMATNQPWRNGNVVAPIAPNQSQVHSMPQPQLPSYPLQQHATVQHIQPPTQVPVAQVVHIQPPGGIPYMATQPVR